MKEIVLEVVLEYRPEDLRAWRGGRKRRTAEARAVANPGRQPSCQFAEQFTLALYGKGGWCGHRFYALGEPARDPGAAAGLADVRRHFSAGSLNALMQERGNSDTGEPTLFLFKSTGETLFLEVTKGRERIPQQRLQALAQIRRILGADVGVVYVKPHGPWYQPRQWELDLGAGSGRLMPRERQSSASLAGLWNPAGH